MNSVIAYTVPELNAGDDDVRKHQTWKMLLGIGPRIVPHLYESLPELQVVV